MVLHVDFTTLYILGLEAFHVPWIHYLLKGINHKTLLKKTINLMQIYL